MMRIIGDNKINICQYTARSHGVFRDEFLGFVAYAMATVNQAVVKDLFLGRIENPNLFIVVWVRRIEIKRWLFSWLLVLQPWSQQ
jgi:hypothetical protein